MTPETFPRFRRFLREHAKALLSEGRGVIDMSPENALYLLDALDAAERGRDEARAELSELRASVSLDYARSRDAALAENERLREALEELTMTVRGLPWKADNDGIAMLTEALDKAERVLNPDIDR